MLRARHELTATILSLLVTASCSQDTPATPYDGGRAFTDSGLCGSTAECPADRTCDPTSHTCVPRVSCTTHDQCGKAAFCTGGQCVRSKTGSPCSTTDNCPPGETCMGGFCGCKGQTYGAQNVPPNVLILLDRSGSMKDSVGGSTKWNIAVAAIKDMLTTQAGKINFGLASYPGTDEKCTTGGQCGAGKVFVDVSPSSAPAITTFLAGASTCSTSNPSFRTPLGATLTALNGYAGLKDTARSNFVLVLTDGQENCNGDPPAAAAALQAQTVPVKTFAVGFGSGVDATELNNVAQKGGTARAGGPPYYYVASDAASLAAAFASIAGQVLSCSYALSEKPKDLSQLYVYQAKLPIARDTTHKNGWDYDSTTNQLTFFGAACQALQSGKVSDLVIVYGCPLAIE
jgi:hypothetical protein